MNITLNKWNTPRFTGVHRGKGEAKTIPTLAFRYENDWYHATGKDIPMAQQGKDAFWPLIKGMVVGDLTRSTVGPTPGHPESALQKQKDIFAALVAKEPNHRLKALLKAPEHHPQQILPLLLDPEVETNEISLPDLKRFLENQQLDKEVEDKKLKSIAVQAIDRLFANPKIQACFSDWFSDEKSDDEQSVKSDKH